MNPPIPMAACPLCRTGWTTTSSKYGPLCWQCWQCVSKPREVLKDYLAGKEQTSKEQA